MYHNFVKSKVNLANIHLKTKNIGPIGDSESIREKSVELTDHSKAAADLNEYTARTGGIHDQIFLPQYPTQTQDQSDRASVRTSVGEARDSSNLSLDHQGSVENFYEYIPALEEICRDVSARMISTLWAVLYLSSFFFGIFVFEMALDGKNDVSIDVSRVWLPLLTCLTPLALYIYFYQHTIHRRWEKFTIHLHVLLDSSAGLPRNQASRHSENTNFGSISQELKTNPQDLTENLELQSEKYCNALESQYTSEIHPVETYVVENPILERP